MIFVKLGERNLIFEHLKFAKPSPVQRSTWTICFKSRDIPKLGEKN